jgi:hypothetical protein
LLGRSQKMDRRQVVATGLKQPHDPFDSARDVEDVGEIERVANALNEHWRTQNRSATERRHDPVGMIANAAVHVGEPQDSHSQPFVPTAQSHLFACRLGPSVDVDRRDGIAFDDRCACRLAVHLASARGQHPSTVRRSEGSRYHVFGTDDVDRPAALGIGFGMPDAGDRREMDDPVRLPALRCERPVIEDIAELRMVLRGEVLRLLGNRGGVHPLGG